MSDARITIVPAMGLEYEDNMLESVLIGGVSYRRDLPLIGENARLDSENRLLRDQLDAKERSAVRNAKEYKRVRDENEKLRELVSGLMYCADEARGMCARTPVGGDKPFECCPLYDFDAKKYRCTGLKRELGIEEDG